MEKLENKGRRPLPRSAYDIPCPLLTGYYDKDDSEVDMQDEEYKSEEEKEDAEEEEEEDDEMDGIDEIEIDEEGEDQDIFEGVMDDDDDGVSQSGLTDTMDNAGISDGDFADGKHYILYSI
jgi:hypothetical protein